MKLFLLLVIPLLVGSCADHQNASTGANDLKVGGLYLFKNPDSTYSLTKVLALDESVVHLRMFSDTFKTKPININSQDLKILIGHSPLDKNGFLHDKPELLKVEEVKESELEGYKMYLEAMEK